jgi:hypothetical protein
MLCDRCQQIFCDKHVIEHRQQFAHQLDGIMEEHDLIQQELRLPSNKHSLLNNIDKWEKDSIVKIQTTAETVRTDLRQMIDSSKERLSVVCHDITENLRSTRQVGDFCENDLIRAMQQLKQLKMKIASPLSVHLVEDKTSVIHLITIKGTDFENKDFEKTKIYSVSKHQPVSDLQERFLRVIGPVTIDEQRLLVRHNGPHSTFAYILGEQLYSQGRHTVRFRIKQRQIPYNIFFGCISSKVNLSKIHYDSDLVAGWFGYNEVHQHGTSSTNAQMHGYDSNKIETDDVLSLTFDCDEKQIELYPERTKKIHELPVDINKAPFPWQLLVVLTYGNDCVSILYNA